MSKLTRALSAIASGISRPGTALRALQQKAGTAWESERQSGKPVRRRYTDRLQADVGNDGEAYRSATNEVYQAALGMTADELRASRAPHKGSDPEIARNYLTASELKKVKAIEGQIASLPK